MSDNQSGHSYGLRSRQSNSPDLEIEVKSETIVLSDDEEGDSCDEESCDSYLGACGGSSPMRDHSYCFQSSLTSSPPSTNSSPPSTTCADPQITTIDNSDSGPPRACISPYVVGISPYVVASTSSATPNQSSKSCPVPSSPGVLECAICLQTCVHPARLPCSHIFCFLCLKGIAHGRGTCALCRRPIPPDYLDNPDLLEDNNSKEETTQDSDPDKFAWYYEGRNGWWQYDWRTCRELEVAYSKGDSSAEVLIAGYVYIVSFVDMIQSRKVDPARRRAVKRDLATCPKKGIAGLRTNSSATVDENNATAISEAMDKLNINQA